VSAQWIIVGEEQRAVLMDLNGADVAIEPRAVNATEPGEAVNINPHAEGYMVGDSVTLVDRYVAPRRILDDPDYALYAPNMVALLRKLPAVELDGGSIFIDADG